MKKTTFLIILLFATVLTKAQDYQISFSGSGESTTVDSVFVTNLTQGTYLELAGSDILHLKGSLAIPTQSGIEPDLHIYPNPMQATSRIEFYSDKPDDVRIEVFDLNGKRIVSHSSGVGAGISAFEISGFPEGFYTANISTSGWQKSASFISVSGAVKSPAIKADSKTLMDSENKTALKSTKGLVQMQYNDGDTLLLNLIADNHERILTTIPTQTVTINAEFVSCSDLGGNNYAVVTIGNQTWMAENLAYLPSVNQVTDGSEDAAGSYYYVYGYDGTDVTTAKATENYDTFGVLYNWTAAMGGAGSSSANPSGVQGACPDGWHLPSDAEWTELTDYLGGTSVAGGKLKEPGTAHWNSPNNGATNETGFTALPGGFRFGDGTFALIGGNGGWWSATEYGAAGAWGRGVGYGSSDVYRGSDNKGVGISVRCVRD